MDDKKIRVDLYTYTSRRVYIYSPQFYYRLFKGITLERKQYDIYAKTALNVLNTIKARDVFKKRVLLRIRPWFLWWWHAFFKKGFRSPVVVVDGKVISSGEIIDTLKLDQEILKVLRREKFLREED